MMAFFGGGCFAALKDTSEPEGLVFPVLLLFSIFLGTVFLDMGFWVA
jgi:hypothetical protein